MSGRPFDARVLIEGLAIGRAQTCIRAVRHGSHAAGLDEVRWIGV